MKGSAPTNLRGSCKKLPDTRLDLMKGSAQNKFPRVLRKTPEKFILILFSITWQVTLDYAGSEKKIWTNFELYRTKKT